jgi:hypothetical protein
MIITKIQDISAYTRRSLLERKIEDNVPNRLQFLMMLTELWETKPNVFPDKPTYGAAVGIEIMALADEIERTSVDA